jgi:small subunit ribosomal protein S3
MATEKKFLQNAIGNIKLKQYLEKELKKAGVSSIQIQRTPLATRIKLDVLKPGMVVGKRGASVAQLTEQLHKEFGIENPQLDITEVTQPELDAKLMAEKIGKQIEMKGTIKQVMHFVLKDIMNAGAIGAEIIASGKVVGKGAKAKSLRYREGYLKKSGEAMKLVKEGRYVAYLKAGAIGITVKIVRPGTVFSDQIKAPEIPEIKTEVSEEKTTEETPAGVTETQVEQVIEERVEEIKEGLSKKKEPKKKKMEAEEKPATAVEEKKEKKAKKKKDEAETQEEKAEEKKE